MQPLGRHFDGTALTRDTCRDNWRDRPQRVCIPTWQQAFDKTAEEISQLCRGDAGDFPPPIYV